MSKRSLRREYEAKLKAERERHVSTQAVLRDLATERGGVVAALVENRAKILALARDFEPRLLWELLLPSERVTRLEFEWSMAIYEDLNQQSASSLFRTVPATYDTWRLPMGFAETLDLVENQTAVTEVGTALPGYALRTEGDDDAT